MATSRGPRVTHSLSLVNRLARPTSEGGTAGGRVWGSAFPDPTSHTAALSRSRLCLSTVAGDTGIRLHALVFCVSLWLCTAVCSIMPHAVGSRFREVLVMATIVNLIT